MNDLETFLLARIAEDEAVVLHSDGCSGCDCDGPARVVAECKAKRRLVAHFGPNLAYDNPPDRDAWYALLTLAAVYADHPDYRDWPPLL